MNKLWESRADGEYFKLCKVLREFPDKFREHYRMNIKTFDYILDSVKDDLQGYSNFRRCIEAEEKLTVALRCVLVIAVRMKRNYYTCKMLYAVTVLCYLKGKVRSTLSCSKLPIYKHKHQDTALTYLVEIFLSIQLRRRNCKPFTSSAVSLPLNGFSEWNLKLT
jgi:hypothetical protein